MSDDDLKEAMRQSLEEEKERQKPRNCINLSPPGFKEKRDFIPDDGNCLFHVLSKFIKKTHVQIRHEICDFLLDNYYTNKTILKRYLAEFGIFDSLNIEMILIYLL